MWSTAFKGDADILDSREIAAILRFCLAETEEVRGHGAKVLPAELLIKLRSFAAGKLKREDLEEFCKRVSKFCAVKCTKIAGGTASEELAGNSARERRP